MATTSYDRLDPTAPEFSRFSLQQIYFPGIVNILPEDGVDGPPTWFGVDKRTLTTRFPSWLSILAMTEDGNEGVFRPAPPTGNFLCVVPPASLGQTRYQAGPASLAAWYAADLHTRA